MRPGPILAVAVSSAVLAGAGCQALSDLLPTLPTQATPTPKPSPTNAPPPVVIPVVKPTPVPTPVPTPTPPTPTPTPPPSGGSCSLPPSNPANPTCTFDPPQLEGQVDSSITKVTQLRPDLFNFNNKKCDNCYLVKNVDEYVREVQQELSRRGICSEWDGEELAVKATNAASEQYDILLATNHIRRPPGAYRGVCRPSWF